MKSPLLNYTAIAAIFLILGLANSGCKKSTTTITLPTVETFAIISDVTSTTASSGGVVVNYSSAATTANGVVWSSVSSTPVITSDSHTTDATTTTLFTSKLTNLIPNTTYYVRAYATNAGGTAYGSATTFKTTASNSTSTTTVSTFAGNGTAGFVDATGAAAQFNNPQGIAADASGNIYVADQGNNCIRKITPAGVVTTFAGNGTAGFADGTGTSAQFYSPQGVATDASGNVYVADYGNNSIRKITPAGVVTTLAGNGVAGFNNAYSSYARFRTPRALVVGPAGRIFVADKGNNAIRKINLSNLVSRLAGSGHAGYLDASDSSAYFSSPTGITMDKAGENLYVTDLGNNAIRKVTQAGVVTTFAGGSFNYTLLGSPMGITTDASGNMFIADEAGRILEITSSQVLYTVAGTSGSYSFTNGSGTTATFNQPVSVAVDPSGNIYVADAANNAIRKIVITQ